MGVRVALARPRKTSPIGEARSARLAVFPRQSGGRVRSYSRVNSPRICAPIIVAASNARGIARGMA
jgi:hypothetical protein